MPSISYPEPASHLINPDVRVAQPQFRNPDQRREAESLRVVAADNRRLLLIIEDRRPELVRPSGRLKTPNIIAHDRAKIALHRLRRAGFDIEQVTVCLCRCGASVNDQRFAMRFAEAE